MGDALATWFEARSCQRTKSMNECGAYSTLTGLSIAKFCYDTLLKYGGLAKIANSNNSVTDELNFVVEANVLLSGIGFESSGLAAAHAINNGFTAIPQTHAYYHGEKVGLPATLSQIGLNEYKQLDIEIVAKKTFELGKFIYNEAGEINEQKVFDAIIMADNYGKNRVKKT